MSRASRACHLVGKCSECPACRRGECPLVARLEMLERHAGIRPPKPWRDPRAEPRPRGVACRQHPDEVAGEDEE